MSELEELLYKIIKEYPANCYLQLKILGVEERPEYGDKIIRRQYILTCDYDLVTNIDDKEWKELPKKVNEKVEELKELMMDGYSDIS